MIAVIDAGNSKLRVGFYEKENKLTDFTLSTDLRRSQDEYALLFSLYCREKGIDPKKAEGCVLSSVVPSLTSRLLYAIKTVFDKTPLMVGHGIRTGLDIRTERHAELGSDLVANAVGGCGRLPKPFAVVDFGTAITVTVVSDADELLGVMILPGLEPSLKALSASCAALPDVGLSSPRSLLGKSTEDSIVSGCVYGYAAMIDGLLERIRLEYPFENLSAAACGGLAPQIIPYCQKKISIFPDLTLEGLARIYELNKAGKVRKK